MTALSFRSASGRIAGVVSAVPALRVANADLPDAAGADRAAAITGVRARRHWTGAQNGARALCTAAGRRLLASLAWEPESIDTLVYVTQTPELAMPADAYLIARDLGLSERCLTLQVSWACAGYVMGLLTAMRMREGGRALLLVGDATSRVCDPADRATGPLFGDAGSATGVEFSHTEHSWWVAQDPTGAPSLFRRDGARMVMSGMAVAAMAVLRADEVVHAIIQDCDPVYAPGPDLWLFHQANAHILAAVRRRAGLGDAWVPSNIAEWGNCAASSIPLLMTTDTQTREALLADQKLVGMVGFGAGWAWAGCLMRVGPLRCCELIEVEAL